eukprot:TRINITY_DN5881_c0_g5_i1.p1 TRINITY_DN5881_c0_g5~~TRINITY_DN5881_c0_g5_i1.p1  ORF type:complete len:298 (-),score=62.89 TRINITY_DN5881_c0_g5_i1:86-979(-)
MTDAWRACDDGDPVTVNDTCVDGVCLGSLQGGGQSYSFQTMGTGECADRDNRRMARYTGDVNSEKDCEQVCRGDPQCAAFSFAYPLCSIYGSVRVRSPRFGNQKHWAFQAGTDPVAVTIEKAVLAATGQRNSICRKKGVVRDSIMREVDVDVSADDFFSPGRLIIFFILVFLCFFAVPISKFVKKTCCPCLRKKEDEVQKVAQQPKEIVETPLESDDQNPSETEWPDWDDMTEEERDAYLRATADDDDLPPEPPDEEADPAAPPPHEPYEDQAPSPPPSEPGSEAPETPGAVKEEPK